ncbi:putative ribonuclease H-like domain-containing protein [Tanacetum coccineum]|uniref:Ribonuclease H-like domain-containing protein n=1 Tax=Tanacetum coccineum TaxID=301880 RepID=A0ABQ4ZXB6_9ASTR
MVPKAVLMRSGLVSLTTARSVNTAQPKTTMIGNPQIDLQEQGVIDSGYSRHMTGNMSYLTDFEEINGGYVAFGGNPKGGKIADRNRLCFDGKADEGFFVGYSINSKAFRVFNSRTRIVKENMHVQFSKNTPNIAGSGPNWLFDIDALTKSMNYKPVIVGNQSNGNAGETTCDDASKARMESVLGKYYIMLPLWPADLPFSQNLKSSPDVGFKHSGDNEKKVTEELGGDPSNKNDSVNKTNNINTASDGNNTNNVNTDSSTVNTAGIEVNTVSSNTSIKLPNDPNMPELEDIVYSDDYEDVDAEADMNNLNTFMPISPIPTTRIHKYHLVEQIIGDMNLAPQTRRMTKNLEEHGLFSSARYRLCRKSFYNSRNKKDERGIVIKNKARLVAQGYTQEEGINYDEVFAPIARTKAIRLFLAYASYKDFVVYQMDVKSAFLYGKIEEEVYVCQPPGFEDPDFPDRVYKVEKALYGLHQAPRAWYETLSTYLLDNGFQRGKIDKTLFIRRDKGKDIKGKKRKNEQKPTRNEETSTRERFEAIFESGSDLTV